MQLSISTSLQQTQLDVRQVTFNQSQTATQPQLSPPPPVQDSIELSDEARRPRDREHSVGNVRSAQQERGGNPLFDLLKGILEQLTGARVSSIQGAPVGDAAPPTSPDQAPAPATTPLGQQSSFSAQQASLSFESSSLSIGGSITTADGAKLSFALDLQMMHASASASAFNLSSDQNGQNFSFAGTAAELSSTSFSFSLTADLPDGTPATGSGLGTFNLKDDLKEVRHALKPLIKEFLKDNGMPSDRNSVNQLLHTIA